MNAVEIEEAVSQLAEAPFDPEGFPYAFLEAFGNKETTLKRLKSKDANKSDLPGAVLQRGNIHIKVCGGGEVTATLSALRESPATQRHKAKFILATDGQTFEAENLVDGETVACGYADFHDHFGFFLPLAGITTVQQIRENAFDIKATGRLNRLYIELLKVNPDWDTVNRREDLNHFFARLIFCFFAEDTSIFNGTRLFTATIEQMSERDASNTHEVLAEIFRAMNTKLDRRNAAKIRSWADQFPYVNGNLFANCEPEAREPQAREPQAREPQAREPQAREPQAREPQAREPQAREPQAREPQAREPQAREPQAREPQAREPQAREPQAREPQAREPQAREPQAREPQAREPQAREPQAREPQAREPQAREPQAREPQAREPQAREPQAREPQAREPQALARGEFTPKTPRADAWGSLNAGSVPRFSKIARSYLLHVGNLDWTKINPDIFGSMIQAVADDEERGALGMHYTSVPNILKVLNPLFLDDLRAKLAEASGNPPREQGNTEETLPRLRVGLPGNPPRKQGPVNLRKLLHLRQRLARIRVFDPACGSGNFLVIAYKEMRGIEAQINRLRGEPDRPTEIPLTNFRGIEIRHFSAEIARLALIIAEYQCDVLYLGQKHALAEFLPLEAANWITCGNALRLDWLSVCPPTGTGVKSHSDDLFKTPLDQVEMDFENEGGETYICGNPPYKGGTEQTVEQKRDMGAVFANRTDSWKSLDYVCGWFLKFADYAGLTQAACAFVSTNSIAQGEQVARLWPLILKSGLEISFAHTSFKWSNLASHKAGVTVVIVGLSKPLRRERIIFELNESGQPITRSVTNINPYLVGLPNIIVKASTKPLSAVPSLVNGSKPVDGGYLSLMHSEARQLVMADESSRRFVRAFWGSDEFINGKCRFCLWIGAHERVEAEENAEIRERLLCVARMREKSTKPLTRAGAASPHRFQQLRQQGGERVIIVPSVSSENRRYLPTGLLPPESIISNLAYGFLSEPIWVIALIASRLHLVWIAAVCGKLETRYRYSTTLGWNTFPVPTLTEQNKADLTRSAEEILLAREAHFPATIADLYDPEKMPANLRAAHDRNDETLERIYLGRRFKNDTERLEKLFELYTATSSASHKRKRVET